MKTNKNGNWKLYWGAMPLPEGSEVLGTITRDNGESGALIRLPTGIYSQGNAGVLRSLPQSEIDAAVQRSAAAAALGSARSNRKATAAKANRAKGGGWPKGRPRKTKNE